MSAFPFLFGYALGSNGLSLKNSSYDTKGGNADNIRLAPGHSHEIFNYTGSGVITHIWITIGDDAPNSLKNFVLRAYWEGNEKPSVEVPIGDFFGLNLNQYFTYQSAFLNCSPAQGLNCYFSMPFRRSARITITNEGPSVVITPVKPGKKAVPPSLFYWNIDFRNTEVPPDAFYFHAQYRQAVPNRAAHLTALNTDGAHNYVFVETAGRGHLMGVNLGIVQNSIGWFGEGDDMTFIDDPTTPAINGTGTEDYFNGAWDFGGPPLPFGNLYNGAPYIQKPQQVGGQYVMYRWHADNPINFENYLRHTIEHGDQNDRFDDFYSVAYWYQSVPFTDFPPLPPAVARIPVPKEIRRPTRSVRPPK
jgi:Protein of unknown function (DUF2961)